MAFSDNSQYGKIQGFGRDHTIHCQDSHYNLWDKPFFFSITLHFSERNFCDTTGLCHDLFIYLFIFWAGPRTPFFLSVFPLWALIVVGQADPLIVTVSSNIYAEVQWCDQFILWPQLLHHTDKVHSGLAPESLSAYKQRHNANIRVGSLMWTHSQWQRRHTNQIHALKLLENCCSWHCRLRATFLKTYTFPLEILSSRVIAIQHSSWSSFQHLWHLQSVSSSTKDFIMSLCYQL